MSVDLRVDWCSYEAAKYAVEHWHYSRSMPAGKTVKTGAWEDGRFIGTVIFGRGGTYTIGDPYGLEQTQVCELVRVALTNHLSPTSKIVATAVKRLTSNSPGLRLIVSYADSKEGHTGTIYQAMNWLYVGDSLDSWIKVKGEITHRRSLTSNYGTNSLEWLRANVDPNAERVNMPPKHKYLYPLDKAMRRQIAPLSQPYPKRAAEVTPVDTANDQLAEGAAAATRPL